MKRIMKTLQRQFYYIFTRVMLSVWIFLGSVSILFLLTPGFEFYKNPAESMQFVLQTYIWLIVGIICFFVFLSFLLFEKSVIALNSGFKKMNPFYWLYWLIVRITYLVPKRTQHISSWFIQVQSPLRRFLLRRGLYHIKM